MGMAKDTNGCPRFHEVLFLVLNEPKVIFIVLFVLNISRATNQPFRGENQMFHTNT